MKNFANFTLFKWFLCYYFLLDYLFYARLELVSFLLILFIKCRINLLFFYLKPQSFWFGWLFYFTLHSFNTSSPPLVYRFWVAVYLFLIKSLINLLLVRITKTDFKRKCNRVINSREKWFEFWKNLSVFRFIRAPDVLPVQIERPLKKNGVRIGNAD